jgi:hypothetical protein
MECGSRHFHILFLMAYDGSFSLGHRHERQLIVNVYISYGKGVGVIFDQYV